MIEEGSPFEVLRRAAAGPSRVAIVLIYGLGENYRIWDFVLPLLPDGVDLLGASASPGRLSSGRRTEPGLEMMGDRLGKALSAQGYESVVVAGHSVGTFLAVEVAQDLGDICAGAVLVNGPLVTVGDWLQSPIKRTYEYPAVAARTMVLFVLVSLPLPAPVRKHIGRRDGFFGHVARLFLSERSSKNADILRALIASSGDIRIWRDLWVNRDYITRFRHLAPDLRCPIMVLVGEEDPIVTASDLRELEGLFRHPTVQVVPEAGHALPLEASEVVAGALSNALGQA
jgi:pimeloyl-ACP methyl ester carboxylesterase